MKKIMICLIGAIILSNCEIKPKEVQAQASEYILERRFYITDTRWNNGVHFIRVSIDSMEYGIMTPSSGYQIPLLVNLTKDKLEIELLRKKLRR